MRAGALAVRQRSALGARPGSCVIVAAERVPDGQATSTMVKRSRHDDDKGGVTPPRLQVGFAIPMGRFCELLFASLPPDSSRGPPRACGVAGLLLRNRAKSEAT